MLEGDLPSYDMPGCKNAAGYYVKDDMDLVDLVIGSDGTFGVFTEIELRLLAMPSVIYGLNCFFPTKPQAIGFSRLLRLDCPRVVAVEYLGRNCLRILRESGKKSKIPKGSVCMLYLEIHAETEEDAMDEVQAVLSDIEEVGADPDAIWIAEDYAGRARMLEMRHLIPVTVNEKVAVYKQTHPGLTKTASDMAVPDKKFRKVLKMYDKDLEAGDFKHAVWGHFGDNHLHVNVIPHTMGEMHRAKEMYTRWAKKVTKMGGTVSAEHGTGKLKAPLLRIMYGEDGIREMAALRRRFDPDGMLGRGNLFKQDP